MSNRRNFIKHSGSLALGGYLLSRNTELFTALANKSVHPIGIQLYTVTGLMDNDTRRTLEKIAAIGYKELESAFSRKGGYYGMKPKEFASLTKDLGLAWLSHHVLGAPFQSRTGSNPPANMPKMNTLKDGYQQLIDEAAEGGLQYLVCASIPLNNEEDIKNAVEILNKAGEASKKSGITLAYHNHTHEFENVEGQIPYDVLLSQVSSDILKMELDLAWATKAGADPVELFKKHPGRFPLWHAKDIDKVAKNPAEVGTGLVNFKRIFDKAKKAGMKHFFVEQDGPPKPLENITASFNYLNKMLK
jgi:sugar phosphate isomerase/epimerase